MFNSRQNLRISRKGVMRTSEAQNQNLEKLKQIDGKIERSTVEQIPLEIKCQLHKQLESLKEQVFTYSDQKTLETKITELAGLIEKMRNGAYNHLLNCENIDALCEKAKALEESQQLFRKSRNPIAKTDSDSAQQAVTSLKP